MGVAATLCVSAARLLGSLPYAVTAAAAAAAASLQVTNVLCLKTECRNPHSGVTTTRSEIMGELD